MFIFLTFVDLLSCLADNRGLIEESKLSLLISNCVQIPRQLGELASFGGANIEPSVQSCLQQVCISYTLEFLRVKIFTSFGVTSNKLFLISAT